MVVNTSSLKTSPLLFSMSFTWDIFYSEHKDPQRTNSGDMGEGYMRTSMIRFPAGKVYIMPLASFSMQSVLENFVSHCTLDRECFYHEH